MGAGESPGGVCALRGAERRHPEEIGIALALRYAVFEPRRFARRRAALSRGPHHRAALRSGLFPRSVDAGRSMPERLLGYVQLESLDALPGRAHYLARGFQARVRRGGSPAAPLRNRFVVLSAGLAPCDL